MFTLVLAMGDGIGDDRSCLDEPPRRYQTHERLWYLRHHVREHFQVSHEVHVGPAGVCGVSWTWVTHAADTPSNLIMV